MRRVIVCVPTFNRAAYLGDCLRSLLSQDFADLQIVIVDNHSEDNTAEVVQAFSDPRVRYERNEKNLGMTGNWNRSVEIALESGSPYIAIYHSDDIYLPGIVGREVDFLERHPRAGLVHTAMHFGDSEGNLSARRQSHANDRVTTGLDLLNELCQKGRCFIAAPSVMARREAYLAAGRFDPQFKVCPDLDLWWRMAEHFDVGYIAQPLMIQRIHPDQTSSSSAASRAIATDKELLITLERALDRLARKHPLDARWYQARIRRVCAINMIRAGLEGALRSDLEFARHSRLEATKLCRDRDVRLLARVARILEQPLCRPAFGMTVKLYRKAKNAVWR